MLDQILAGRNGTDGTETLGELVGKVLANAQRFIDAQELTGYRHRLEKAIKQAATKGALETIAWEADMPNMRLINNNLHDTAILNTTSNALPIEHTQRSERARSWRSTDVTEQGITATLQRHSSWMALCFTGITYRRPRASAWSC